MLYRVLYEIRYIKIFLNTMKLVFKKKFGKSRVRYIIGSVYRGLTVVILGGNLEKRQIKVKNFIIKVF